MGARAATVRRSSARRGGPDGCGGEQNVGAEAVDATSRALGASAFVGGEPGLAQNGALVWVPVRERFSSILEMGHRIGDHVGDSLRTNKNNVVSMYLYPIY